MTDAVIGLVLMFVFGSGFSLAVVCVVAWAYSKVSHQPTPWGGYSVPAAPVIMKDDEDEARIEAEMRRDREARVYDSVDGLGV